MIDDKKIIELTEQLYCTAFDVAAWDGVLASITDHFNGTLATLMTQDPVSGHTEAFLTHNMDITSVKAYADHYAAISTLVPHAQSYGVGEVFTEQMVPDQQEYLNSATYNDYFRPLGADHLVQTLLAKDDATVTTILFRRDRRSGPYEEDDKEDLRRLFPHLEQAHRVHLALSKASQKNMALTETIDCLKVGVILVDHRGRVVHFNRVAQDILNDNDGFAINRGGRIVSALPDERRDLNRLIDQVCRREKQVEIDPGGAMRLSRPSCRRSYTLLVAPVLQHGKNGDKTPAAVIFIGDPEKAHNLPPHTISHHFGLTSGEAMLVSGLIEGTSLRDVADQLAITEHTARSVLKKVFAKTETNRQSDLVSLVLSAPAIKSR